MLKQSGTLPNFDMLTTTIKRSIKSSFIDLGQAMLDWIILQMHADNKTGYWYGYRTKDDIIGPYLEKPQSMTIHSSDYQWHHASAPMEYPAYWWGGLQQQLHSNVFGYSKMTLSSNAPYSSLLEYGGVTYWLGHSISIKPRRYMYQTIYKFKPYGVYLLRKYIQKSL